MNNVYVLIIHGGQPSARIELLPWKLQAHLQNINYPSDIYQSCRCSRPTLIQEVQPAASITGGDREDTAAVT